MKHIVLIDFTLAGHHLSFIRSFSTILLNQGHIVSCIVPGYIEVEDWVKRNNTDNSNNFKGFEYSLIQKPAGIHKNINPTIEVLRRWRKEGKQVKEIEIKRKKKVDLVFYAWLDYQLARYIPGLLLNTIFPYKWSGLYFHPYHLRESDLFLNRKANWRDIDAVFLAGNCLAVALHDQSIVEKYSKRIGKKVLHFPETADDTKPDLFYKHYKAIKEKANGRIIVGMIGCEKHKGTLTMMRMAKNADASKYYFAFLGVLPEQTYAKNEWIEVQHFISSPMENCYFYFHPIPEGAEYNAVFSAFDIPFLVYEHFISSSNRLTKAAIFKKLVLASNNFCVGDDVRKYKLGATVQPGDFSAALSGLESLAEKISSQEYPENEWMEYNKINSEEILKERFKELISLI
jgi:hypothetical protein